MYASAKIEWNGEEITFDAFPNCIIVNNKTGKESYPYPTDRSATLYLVKMIQGRFDVPDDVATHVFFFLSAMNGIKDE